MLYWIGMSFFYSQQQVPDNPETAEVWRMYFDGSLKLQGAGAGILFTAPGGEHLKYALQLLFPTSNNAAEYEALIHGLNIAISLERLTFDGSARSELDVVGTQLASPLGYSANGFLVVKNVPYWKTSNYYDFVVVKVVT